MGRKSKKRKARREGATEVAKAELEVDKAEPVSNKEPIGANISENGKVANLASYFSWPNS